MNGTISIFAFLLASVHAAVAGTTADFSHAQGSLEFRAVGKPSALKIVGKSGVPTGSLVFSKDSLGGALSLSLDGLDTGIELRNHHMKEKYLETKTFPQATLYPLNIGIPKEKMLTDFEVSGAAFTGNLLLHGVEKPVAGKVSLKRTGPTLTGDASFQIKLSDFGIAVPSFMGITVADTVDVTTSFKAPLADAVTSSSK